jgi:phosphatidylserine/phosphatidylglycerophosphate/cardiolipin synthase-like enzyme
MKPSRTPTSAVILLPALLCLIGGRAAAEMPTTAPAATQPAISIETHFSPEEEIAPTIVKLIDGAQRSIDVAAFAFTHPDIASALVRAHQRGVRARFLMDYMQSRLKECRADELIAAGIDVHTRHRRGYQHSKYIVIDDAILLTGSYNFATSADDRNTENLLVIRNAPQTVKGFLDDFQMLWADSLVKK